MTLTLFHAPLSCSLASRLALLESGLPHEIKVVHTTRGENLTEAYARINPRRKVPALVTAEGVITESTAILPYIADRAPERALLPSPGTYARAQAQAWLGFLSSTVHAAFSPALFPERIVSEPAAAEALRASALETLVKALTELDSHLSDRQFLLEAFSLCDLYALVFSLWRGAPALAGRLPALVHLDAYQMRLMGRPGLMPIIGEDMAARAAAA
ncbi:glutathione S-transferase family protein [Caulobacter soli]|uniref:glutathione S-transferase family protein n=1 Tax=Caulobacter soli TaxID=2708539 RepID=UPI0013EC974C|nr:glutathione S-transferase N-terminal domain-containing protein [Caulobacter soli]